MSIDTRTAAEKRYDDTKSGAIYIKPGAETVWAPLLDITDDPRDNGRQPSALPLETDTPISPDETRALDILLKVDDRIDIAQQVDQVLAADADRQMDEDEQAIIVWILEMVEQRYGVGE